MVRFSCAATRRPVAVSVLTLATLFASPAWADDVPAEPASLYPADAVGEGSVSGGYALSRWAEDWRSKADPQQRDDLLVEHHAHDRAAQELRQQRRVALGQLFEFVPAQLQQFAGLGHDRVGAAGVVADQQPQLAEEGARAQPLADQVIAEVQFHRTVGDHVHGGAVIAATEQLLSGFHRTGTRHLREQRVLVRVQRGRAGIHPGPGVDHVR